MAPYIILLFLLLDTKVHCILFIALGVKFDSLVKKTFLNSINIFFDWYTYMRRKMAIFKNMKNSWTVWIKFDHAIFVTFTKTWRLVFLTKKNTPCRIFECFGKKKQGRKLEEAWAVVTEMSTGIFASNWPLVVSSSEAFKNSCDDEFLYNVVLKSNYVEHYAVQFNPYGINFQVLPFHIRLKYPSI